MKKIFPFILALLVCVALALGYTFLYTKVAQGIGRLEAALARSEAFAERDALVRSQQVLLEDVREEREHLDVFVVSDAEVIEAIEIIEKAADVERVAVAISSIRTVEDSGLVHHERVEVALSASGTFSTMTRFMSALENLPVASTLTSVALESGTGGEWFGSFSVSFIKEK